MRIAILLMPKSKWLRHFMSYFKTFVLKQALCSVFCNPYSLRSLLGMKKGAKSPFFCSFCGELGIRTPGPVTVNSFQDCRIRPLCQLSAANVGRETQLCKKYLYLLALNNCSNLLTTMYLYKKGLGERIVGFKCVFLEV
jgi:hypothetical protein